MSGVAATGAPMANATIVVSDASPTTADVTTTTAADGSYTVDVSGLVAPLLVRATGIVLGETVTYAAVVPTAPANSAVTTNVSPLTHAIAALVSPGGDPANLANAATIATSVSTSAVGNAVTALVTSLSSDPAVKALLAEATGGSASSFNPMTTGFSATATNPLDRVLEQVKVDVSSTGVKLTNVAASADTAAGTSITLTSGMLSTPTQAPALPTTTVSLTDLPSATVLSALADAFNACFALPTSARRAVAQDGTVTLDPKCAHLAAGDYMSNGYDWAHDFGAVIGDDGMTNAKFSPAAIALASKPANITDPKVLKHPYCNTAPCATVRLGAKQANGGARGHFLVMARTDTVNGGTWKVVGNQRKYDMGIESRVTRMIAVNESAAATSSFAGKSRIESAIRVAFNPSGPNGSQVRLIRVAYAGDPIGEGVVLSRSRQCNNAWRFTIDNKNGLVTSNGSPRFFNANGSNNFIYDAVFVNPTTGEALSTTVPWPGMSPVYDDQPMAEGEQLRAWSLWRVEIFLIDSQNWEVADEIQYLRMANPTIFAKDAAKLGWATIPQSFIDTYLKPTGSGHGAITSADISWTQPAGASQYESAYMFSADMVPTASGNANRRSLMAGSASPVGSTSATMRTGVNLSTRIDSGTSTEPMTASMTGANNPACPNDTTLTDHSLTPLSSATSAYREAGVATRTWSGPVQSSTWFWRGATN